VALSDAARRRVRGAETPHVSAKARRVSDTIEGVLSRSSIFSWRANRLETDGSSKRGDGGTILVSRST
jgi:hypothetical protein